VSLGQEDFCAHFNTLFYSYAYAKSMSKDLVIYDRSTGISPSYALLEETFASLPGLSYSSEMRPMVTMLRPKDGTRFFPLLAGFTTQALRTEAHETLIWKPLMLEKIRAVALENSLPEKFDVGVQIRFPKRFDTVRAPTVQNYLDAVKAAVLKDDSTVFVMADEPAQLDEFKRLAPKTWVIHSVYPRTPLLRGSTIATFGRQSAANKVEAYVEYLTELYCMQQSSKLICNLSNDVGRFLFLTGSATNFRSMDTPDWTPF
jgi:hypothetical protein